MKTYQCANCGDLVPARRPNQSGNSYCRKQECQAAKQRFFRARKREGLYASFTNPAEATVCYVSDALRGRRVKCESCGLEDAILGWLHRGSPGGGPCEGVGSGGRGMVPVALFDAVHPERAAVVEPT